MSTAKFPFVESPTNHNIVGKGLNRSLGSKGGEEVINEDQEEDRRERGALGHAHNQGLGDGGGAHTKRSLPIVEECTDLAHQAPRDISIRGGHGIPKCSPCLSVFFLMPLGPSVHFRGFFLGLRVCMSIIWTVEIPKIGKIRAKIRAFVY